MKVTNAELAAVYRAEAAHTKGELNELALFAGGGGGILAAHMLGWRTRCAVEFDAGARSILLDRQRDGVLPLFPIWDDVRTFDGQPWRGSIDVISGGFPCHRMPYCESLPAD